MLNFGGYKLTSFILGRNTKGKNEFCSHHNFYWRKFAAGSLLENCNFLPSDPELFKATTPMIITV